MDKSSIGMQEGSTGGAFINIEVLNVNANFSLVYHLLSRPNLVRDEGVGSIRIDNMNISLKLSPYNDDGHLQFELWDSMIQVDNYQFKLEGTSNVSQAVELTMNKLKDMFKEELLNILARKISKSLELTLNRGIDSNLLLRPLGDGSNILLNCTLTQAPIITSEYLALPFDGNFLLKGQKS